MSFNDILRSFLGLPRYDSGARSGGLQNDFRNPIWNVDDDDDTDDELYQNSTNHNEQNSHGSFHIYSDPLNMQRYFESQMSDALSLFGGMMDLFERTIAPPDGGFRFTAPPLPGPTVERSLRDEYLKPGNQLEANTKRDDDLDGQIGSEDLTEFFKKKPSKSDMPEQPSSVTPHFFNPNTTPSFFYGKSITIQSVTKPDGTVETHRTVRDSDGTETTTTTTWHKNDNTNVIREQPEDVYKNTNIWKNFFGN